MEGDSRYVAPELLQFMFTKAADIFSVGITTLELACNMDLPKSGPLWGELRNDKFPPCFDCKSSVNVFRNKIIHLSFLFSSNFC